MKFVFFSLVLVALAVAKSQASQASPIEKVLEMISGLQQKVIAAGEDAQKVYDNYAEWCEDKAHNLVFEIKTGKADVTESKATIESETSLIGALEAKIEELSADLQTDESDLKAATSVRAKEAADFAAEEKELTEILSSIERAISMLSREAKKGGAAMLQTKSVHSLTDALDVMVQASAISSADASRLTALVQEGQEASDADSDSDSDMGAPAAEVYESHSEGVISTLEGLQEKAESRLEKARKSERTSVQNFEMLKQSLTDAMKFANNDMAKAKKDLASSQEKKAVAQGDLDTAAKDLEEDIGTKQTLHQDCMSAAEEFEVATKSRGEELNSLAAAKKAIQESTGGAGGAAEQTYGLNQMSFLQSGRTQSSSKAANSQLEVVHFVRKLARQTQSASLAQLASRMSSAMKLSSVSGGDPFAKIKGLITDMIATLEDDAATEASHKAYCDKELAESSVKQDDLTTDSNSLSTKIAQAQAAFKKLKGQIATLQGELASMVKAKAEASQLRGMEKSSYEKNSAAMQQGVDGIKLALKVLKEYYAKGDQGAEEGAGSGIIGLLEVCESDFTKGLAEMTAEEESAAANFKRYVQEDEVVTTAKAQDVKYKTKEAAGLDKQASEMATDLTSVTDELAAVNTGLARLKKMCVMTSLPYEERKARREAEVAGLKQALQILDGQAVLLQQSTRHTLRGVSAHQHTK
jgi:hypothetical protein